MSLYDPDQQIFQESAWMSYLERVAIQRLTARRALLDSDSQQEWARNNIQLNYLETAYQNTLRAYRNFQEFMSSVSALHFPVINTMGPPGQAPGHLNPAAQAFTPPVDAARLTPMAEPGEADVSVLPPDSNNASTDRAKGEKGRASQVEGKDDEASRSKTPSLSSGSGSRNSTPDLPKEPLVVDGSRPTTGTARKDPLVVDGSRPVVGA